MRYSIFPVVTEDLDRLYPKGTYSLGELGCTRELIDISRLRDDVSICQGFGPSGELYGIAGSYRQWEGSAQLWAVFDGRVNRHPIALYKACCLLINYAVQKQKLKRVSLTVRASYTEGNRFAQSLGFDLEGRMVGFLPDGADANLFARLF